jgi:hypothetical protein
MSRKIVVEEDDDAEWIAKLEKRQEEYETRRIFNFTEILGTYSGIGLSLESFLAASREVQLFIVSLYHDKEHLQGTLEEIKDLCA